LTAKIFRKFYKLQKDAQSNFILRQSETLPRRKYDKTTESDYILMISNWRLATKTRLSIQTLLQGNPKRYPV